MGPNWAMSCSNDNRLLSTTYKKEKVRLAGFAYILQKYIWLGLLDLGLINLIDYFKGIENIYSSVSLLVLSLIMF